MAATPESKVKKAVAAMLKEHGAYFFFPAMGAFGRAGVPDIVGCYKGRFFAVECKAGKNTTTALQNEEINKIRTAKGAAFVINETNQQDLSFWLEFIGKEELL